MTETAELPVNPHAEHLARLKPVLPLVGRGLQQLISPSMTLLEKAVTDLRAIEVAAPTQKLVKAIDEEYDKFNRLHSMQDVNIVGHGGKWTLRPSEAVEEKLPTFPPGTVTIQGPELQILTDAISDALFNPLSAMGLGEYVDDPNQPQVKKLGTQIANLRTTIYEQINPFRMELKELQIVTDEEGKVTLTPVFPPPTEGQIS